MLTPWGETLDTNQVLPEYPRPQMVRQRWQNLNGQWDFAQTDLSDAKPQEFNESILVPFPVESTLSGVQRAVTPDQAVWYQHEFKADHQPGERLLLHFGAVDWATTVWVNGTEVGRHEGGFDPFSFDITDALAESDVQTVLVRVTDPTNHGDQPHGKQSLEPGGIVYTAVTGIWQTVWLEPVPATRIASLKLTPKVKAGVLEVIAEVAGDTTDDLVLRVTSKTTAGKVIAASGPVGKPLELQVPQARLWSPNDPYLYDLSVEVTTAGPGKYQAIDHVDSYFGMRSVNLFTDSQGQSRIALNGREQFCLGPLDQGWWPDGLYTAPSEEALRWDIETAKKLGFNTLRKHVKVEPSRWYYLCDKLGMLVWQDMPNSDRAIGPNEQDLIRSSDSEQGFRKELQAMIDTLGNHPSIIVWTPFNEGWGQFKTNEIIRWIKDYDPTRLVDGPSGWSDRGEGDLIDMHSYPGPDMHEVGSGRASIIGEFGGLGLVVPDNLWFESGSWGYQTLESQQELENQYQVLLDNVWLLKREGLAAAIYTQLTDVEGEVNGFATYNRRVLKCDPQAITQLNKRLYAPAPNLQVLVPSSQDDSIAGEFWSYTTETPAKDWTAADFDDSKWLRGQAGFGSPNTPGATVRTEWNTSDIWLRKEVEFTAPKNGDSIYFNIHHDEDAEIYINGREVLKLAGFTADYRIVEIPEESRKLLLSGKAVLAVHCHQSIGGQYVDLGLIALHAADDGDELTSNLPDHPSAFGP
ncbi:glycoside hydrolase family 2 protein [Aeoliella mucimassa]|uniref:Beta-galactosidase large subunit n=1 Tax=Aeoliella mucimassa TaxID=2527972 RepID=A0A518ASA7_9BACT|nr:glycoside hydrolase family 2 TIM barrel-domain containing protein [Aeoliella mucimassa]QDU57602.1 Beta-galactosidase large subunit [Aeoliella mucimassa]